MACQQHSVEHIFGAALERGLEERGAYLDRACAGDRELRQRVDELLHDYELAANFLGEPIGCLGATPPPIGSSAIAPSNGQRPALSSRFHPGDIIAARFTVVRFIARGGMGEVYEVEDALLQHLHVALKVILPEVAADAASSHRFEQEVLLARDVRHPNLCPIYDISLCAPEETTGDQQDGTDADAGSPFLFLTMKLLRGETLAARLRKDAPIPRDQSISIFRQLIAGLSAIHAAGVIHRDIKPTNVMLELGGQEICVSIMDFGLARLHESEATILAGGVVAGTPGYIAPELFLGQRPSEASDIYALGVLLHQVLTGAMPSNRPSSRSGLERPAARSASWLPSALLSRSGSRHRLKPITYRSAGRPISETAELAVEPSSSLGVSDVPATLIEAVQHFLAQDPNRRCLAFEQLQAYFGLHSVALSRREFLVPRRSSVTRRSFAFGAALTACTLLAGGLYEGDRVRDFADGVIDDIFHGPLPRKRFVAILNWPAPADSTLKPMLSGIIDAIAAELARAEAFDHDLFVTAQRTTSELTTPAQLNEVRESLGANLILAASGIPDGPNLHLSLRVFDPTSGDSSLVHPLRETNIRVPIEEQATLPARAVRAAARLLNIGAYTPDDQRSRPGTSSAEALAAFQAAEAMMKQPNHTGLDAAIEKYKQAVDVDSHYAAAYAKLAHAYFRFYELHGDAAAIAMAQANCKSAIDNDPNLVQGHLEMAWVLQTTGDDDGAARELSKALSLDPSDTNTLNAQAYFYAAESRWSEAEATYASILRRRPNNWLAHNELAVMLAKNGKFARAVSEFQAAILANPKNALALANLGDTYLQQGRLAEALTECKKSLELHPSAEAAETIAAVYLAQHNFSDAISFAQRATRLGPSMVETWLLLADCYAASPSGEAEAAKSFIRAQELQEEQLRTELKNGPAWMLLALCRAKTGHPDAAALLIKKAESLQADDLYSQLFKARTLELIGRRADALTTLARCIQRGATAYQLRSMPDMDGVRANPRFRSLLRSNENGDAAISFVDRNGDWSWLPQPERISYPSCS